ncbi:MAG: hypothetical protein H6765_07645 [Candidatus Peribacteria bacterium]|nr:MAG: hypothetical protein H6765_07645 [Candidatus Peribacteria bacterium]
MSSECLGDNTFVHALAFSCNVGMVRIAQKITKYVFYAYLAKLGFGQPTGIELAGEQAGTLPDFNTVSVARYFNNTYGQGLLATPLQMAIAYGALVNGGYLIEPTVVEAVYDNDKSTFWELAMKAKKKIFKTETSQQMKEALVSVIDDGNLKNVQRP